jgi:hypothetical protein
MYTVMKVLICDMKKISNDWLKLHLPVEEYFMKSVCYKIQIPVGIF